MSFWRTNVAALPLFLPLNRPPESFRDLLFGGMFRGSRGGLLLGKLFQLGLLCEMNFGFLAFLAFCAEWLNFGFVALAFCAEWLNFGFVPLALAFCAERLFGLLVLAFSVRWILSSQHRSRIWTYKVAIAMYQFVYGTLFVPFYHFYDFYVLGNAIN